MPVPYAVRNRLRQATAGAPMQPGMPREFVNFLSRP
jgi:hypothetical protein